MAQLHAKLPDGRSSNDAAEVMAAYDDEALWIAPSSEMYISIRDGAAHSMLTVIRRQGAGTCLICKEASDQAPGQVSTGGRSAGMLAVELQDVTVRYPGRFFIDDAVARRAIKTFLADRSRDDEVGWRNLDQAELEFEPFE